MILPPTLDSLLLDWFGEGMSEDASKSGARVSSDTGKNHLQDWEVTVGSATKETLDLISGKTGESASEIIGRLVRDEANKAEAPSPGEEQLDDLPEYELGGGV